jgi:hypothetical protein
MAGISRAVAFYSMFFVNAFGGGGVKLRREEGGSSCGQARAVGTLALFEVLSL